MNRRSALGRAPVTAASLASISLMPATRWLVSDSFRPSASTRLQRTTPLLLRVATNSFDKRIGIISLFRNQWVQRDGLTPWLPSDRSAGHQGRCIHHAWMLKRKDLVVPPVPNRLSA